MDTIFGWPNEVIDGDTFKLDVDSRSQHNQHPYADFERVRLRDRDAPELNEPGGRAAKARLVAEIMGHRLRVEVHTRDKYGRVVGTIGLES